MADQNISYVPQVLNLSFYSGDGGSFRIVAKDGNDAAINLTGTMRAQVRKTRTSPDPPDAIFSINLDDAADGIAVITITGEQTQLLAPTSKYSGVWDLEWTPVGAEPMTLCQGTVECKPDVSH
jgi:hypothetical protein